MNIELKDRLKQARKEAKKTQQEVADIAGMTQPSYSELERGESQGSKHLALIANYLGVSALWLTSGEGEKIAMSGLVAPSTDTRQVVPGCDVEGSVLEAARIAMKRKDKRFTQEYVAALVGLNQGIYQQWKTGTTRILDRYWLMFADALAFDPFELRPEIREIRRLIDKVDQQAGTALTDKSGAGLRPDIQELLALNMTELEVARFLGEVIGRRAPKE